MVSYLISNLKPHTLYSYKSLLEEVIVSYNYDTVGFEDAFFTKDKNDDISYYNWFKEFIQEIKNRNPNLYISTNKIVICCKTKEDNDLNISWYDGTLSFGFGRRGDMNKEPIKLK